MYRETADNRRQALTGSDEELLQAFVQGRRSALGELAGRYEVSLLNLSLAILGSRELACDAVQETWVRVLRFAHKFNGQSRFKTWFYRIAINQCRSLLAGEKTGGAEGPEQPASEAHDPSRQAVANDEAEKLKRAVEGLTPPLRETILLCYTHGLTHEETAEVMQIPLGTVKSRVHAALEQLRETLKADAPDA